MRIFLRAATLGLVGLLAISCGRTASPDGSKSRPARADRRTQTFEFPKARQGTVLHHVFTVKNDGTTPLKVARVQTTCGCTVATVAKDTVIEPGKSLEVPVDLNLRGKHTPVESKVIVNYADGAVPDELVLKGAVSEEYQDVVTLPKVRRGEQPEQVVTLSTYPGQQPLTVGEITFDPAKFEVTSRPGAKEGTVDIAIKAAKDAPYGSVVDQVQIKTNDTELPVLSIAARVHILKPLEAVTPRLVLQPGKDGEPATGIAEFKSTYGEPITDVIATISRDKRFTATVMPDSPPDTVRVKVTATPPEKKKKPLIDATLKMTAKVGADEVDERMTVVYVIDPKAVELRGVSAPDEPEGDAGKH